MSNISNKSSFRRDTLITLLVITGFTIAAFGFHVQEKIFTAVWGMTYRMGFFGEIFLGWGIWSVTLAVFIVGLLISLDHYWKWIAVASGSILIVWSMDMTLSNTLSNFKGVWNFEDFFGCLSIEFVVFLPFAILVAWCIYYVRKKLR